jgi:hydroxypyruvate isomerase
MTLSVSQIAWQPGEDGEAHALLSGMGIGVLEAAPTRHFPYGLDVVTEEELIGLRRGAEGAGMRFGAMQALLFSKAREEGQPTRTGHLAVFGAEEVRRELVDYLKRVIDAAAVLGAGPLVFGSPGNRRRGGLDEETAREMAVPLFREVGEYAAGRGCVVALEANPVDYGCDWLTGIEAVAEFVGVVDSPGVRVHWDCGCVRLNGEDAVGLLERLAPVLAHYHVSVPFLKEPGEDGFPHRECAAVLRAAGYGGLVSLEMGRSARGLDGLRESAAKLVEWYA